MSIYVHDSVKIVRQAVSPFTDCFESILLELNYKGVSFMFSEFYHIPNTNVKDFLLCFNNLASSLRKSKFCILCADHNLDLLKSNRHGPTQDFVDKLNDEMFITCILKPTRITHSTSTMIDNIFVKSSSHNKFNSFVITDPMSDHFPCLLSYTMKNVSTVRDAIVFERRKINDDAIQKVCQDLLFYDWGPMHDLSVDDSYAYLVNSITNSLDRHAPKKLIRVKACDRFREPWMTVQLKKYHAKCRKLCDKARKSSNVNDEKRYKMYRNILNRLKQSVKRQHYSVLFIKIGKNSQLLWNVINNIVKKDLQ